jgi:hypothetical protein
VQVVDSLSHVSCNGSSLMPVYLLSNVIIFQGCMNVTCPTRAAPINGENRPTRAREGAPGRPRAVLTGPGDPAQTVPAGTVHSGYCSAPPSLSMLPYRVLEVLERD